MIGSLVLAGMLNTAPSVRIQVPMVERHHEATSPGSDANNPFYELYRNGSNPLSNQSLCGRTAFEINGVVIAPFGQIAKINPEESSLSLRSVVRLNEIKSQLSLSVTQLSELLGVTRKTIYDWYEGVAPRASAMARIEILAHLLSDYPENIDITGLKSVWKISVSGRSFIETLNDNELRDPKSSRALREKLIELSPKLAIASSPIKNKAIKVSNSQLSEFERHADFG